MKEMATEINEQNAPNNGGKTIYGGNIVSDANRFRKKYMAINEQRLLHLNI